MLPIIAAILVLVLYVGIAWVILKRYRQTHNLGFLILGFGVLAWPLGSGLVRTALHRISNGEVGFFPFSLIAKGQITIGELLVIIAYADQAIHAGLILIGLLMIGRAMGHTGVVSNAN